MRQVIALALVLAAVVAAAPRAWAAEDRPLKLGIADLDRALNESRKGKAALAEITKKFEGIARQVEERKRQLRELQDEIEAQFMALSEQARNDRMQDYKDKAKDFERFKQDQQEELRRQKFEASKKIELEIREIVQKIGREKGYTLVLERTEFYPLYADGAIDLTDEVIVAYDRASANQ
ncbi:MAG: OmpH family outer membrane protein [Myxococcales bacterium]|nr:OmpH family outer membrane protein [Myxococcales bacterium]